MHTQVLPAETAAATAATKPHYAILDGLRGVAALLVVAFHLCEAHATSHFDQLINHGYLAVDFFFLLSGFVIGYAYDDRWPRMTLKDFFRARLVRLQPMVVLGMVVGAACFYFQDSAAWPGISEVPVWQMLLVMLIGCTLLPLPTAWDIRGWQEMHPLNGPGWSLFYEYVANLLYALWVRKFSSAALTALVAVAAVALISVAVGNGDVVGGWALTPEQLRIGFSRVLFPFFGGLLLSRTAQLRRIDNAFLWCSLLLIAALALPRFGGPPRLWLNGLYESACIILLFPLIVWLGAGGQTRGRAATRLCKFFGDVSYPLYLTHFPLVYIYTGWVSTHKPTPAQALPLALLTFAASLVLAYASLKLYDEPVRQWLKNRLLSKG